MNIILTSSLDGSFKVNGKRVPSVLLTDNGLYYQLLKNDYLDGLRVMEDITYADSNMQSFLVDLLSM